MELCYLNMLIIHLFIISSKKRFYIIYRIYKGKYSITNTSKLLTILSNITKYELHNILNYSFDELWNSLWSTNLNTSSAKKFEKEYASSLRKFNFIKSSTNTINIYDILTVLKINYNDTEWGYS